MKFSIRTKLFLLLLCCLGIPVLIFARFTREKIDQYITKKIENDLLQKCENLTNAIGDRLAEFKNQELKFISQLSSSSINDWEQLLKGNNLQITELTCYTSDFKPIFSEQKKWTIPQTLQIRSRFEKHFFYTEKGIEKNLFSLHKFTSAGATFFLLFQRNLPDFRTLSLKFNIFPPIGFFLRNQLFSRPPFYENNSQAQKKVKEKIAPAYFGSYLWQENSANPLIIIKLPVPHTYWNLVAFTGLARAKMPLKDFQTSILFAILTVLAICLVLGFQLSRAISKPVIELLTAFQQFSSGNLNYRLQVMRNDEFGELQKNFNAMGERLQGSYKTLEEKSGEVEKSNLLLSEKIDEWKLLCKFSTLLGSEMEESELLKACCKLLMETFAVKRASIILTKDKHPVIKSAFGFKKKVEFESNAPEFIYNLKLDKPGKIVSQILEDKKPILGKAEIHDRNTEYQSQYYMAVPLFKGENIQGIICLTEKLNDIPFEEKDLHLFEVLGNQILMILENFQLKESALLDKILKRELELAQIIQKSMLPILSPANSYFQMKFNTEPARTIGGDYFNFWNLGKKRWALMLGDVSGKGIPAALVTVALHAFLSQLKEDNLEPGDIVSCLNERLFQNLSEKSGFVTFFFAIIDLQKNILSFCNAGHDFPILQRADGSSHDLVSQGVVLGFFPTEKYKTVPLKIEEGDILCVYSDGLLDCTMEKFGEFNRKEVKKIIREHRHKNVDEIFSTLWNKSLSIQGNNDLFDDRTLAIIKIASTNDQS
ncbi:SpoIIE family protein phosphatase [Candidatus Riflebacteria bacterium]